MKKGSVILIFLISILLISCAEKSECKCDKFGVDFNDERKEIGIVPLDETWELHKAIGESCESPNSCVWEKRTEKGFARKYLLFSRKGEPQLESDTYYMNYKDVLDADLSTPDYVTIDLTYDFDEKMFFFDSHGDLQGFPDYVQDPDQGNGEESILNSFMEVVDYLHYECGISLNDLPTINRNVLPLKRME